MKFKDRLADRYNNRISIDLKLGAKDLLNKGRVSTIKNRSLVEDIFLRNNEY